MNKLLYCALCALLWAGCSDDEPSGGSVDLRSPIQPVVRLADKAPSRSIVNAGSAFSASLFRVDASGSAYPSNYTDVAALPADVAGDGSLTITPEQYYQINGDNTALLGVYPAVGSNGAWNAGAGTVGYTLDGATDVMATSFVEGHKDSDQPVLVFSHLLTQVQVSVYAQDQAAIDLWGVVESIAVAGREPECTLTLPGPGQAGAVSAAFSGTPVDLLLTNADGTPAPSLTVTATSKSDAQPFGYCMFAPVTDALTLKIATSKGDVNTVTLPSGAFEQGVAYTLTVKMTTTGFTADDSATITGWEEGITTDPIPGEMI